MAQVRLQRPGVGALVAGGRAQRLAAHPGLDHMQHRGVGAMAFKVFGMLKRPDGMSFAQFKKWWLEVHVPRVMKWPGLVGYDVNFALNENEPFDGVGIVCFDNKEAAEKVFQTLEGSSARSAAIAESSRNAIFLAEEVVIVPREKAHQG